MEMSRTRQVGPVPQFGTVELGSVLGRWSARGPDERVAGQQGEAGESRRFVDGAASGSIQPPEAQPPEAQPPAAQPPEAQPPEALSAF